MKLEDARITILINGDFTTIEIIDFNTNVTLAKIKLTPEQICRAFSRQALVECECYVGEFSKIGKRYENKSFEFEIKYTKSKEDLLLACNEALFLKGMYDWKPDDYFQSQNSFFEKDGKKYARTTIRRWV